jgi:ribosomal protein L30E
MFIVAFMCYQLIINANLKKCKSKRFVVIENAPRSLDDKLKGIGENALSDTSIYLYLSQFINYTIYSACLRLRTIYNTSICDQCR